ncbi:hypothetical protein BDZ91DRAFT_437327 [Kalaharituber pfeilii]|nr:hypothetical protein BDZ91DRAFT_437327 [Kalaharituber pfeilii]
MDYEEEATQLCTQPLAATKRGPDDTTGVLCTLFPTTAAARATVTRLMHTNRDFVFIQHASTPLVPNISAVTTSDEQLENDLVPEVAPETLSIALRFQPGPKDATKGFCLGRNYLRCDVVLGDAQTSRRVSNIHFRIFVNDQHVLMLEDCSTNGTFVDGTFLGPRGHNNHGKTPEHLRPTARQLINGSEIHILKGPRETEIRFMVRIPKSDGSGFLGDGDDYSTFDPDNPHRNEPVAGPSAFYRHIQSRIQQEDGEESADHAEPKRTVVQPHQQVWAGSPKYQLLDTVGQGAFATVHKAIRRKDGEPVAIKIIARRVTIRNLDRNTKKNGGVKKEVEILEQLRHPNIVQYHECLEDDGHIYIVMEYIGGGNLEEYVQKHLRMAEPLVQDVTRQVLRGIQYVHEMGISHRDLKPDNILISCNNPIAVKISDFGLAKMVRAEETFLKTFCGTMLYLAPEVFPSFMTATMPAVAGSKRKHDALDGDKPKQQRRYNQAVDMWSIGVVTYTLLTGKRPFEATTQDEIYKRIITAKFDIELLRKSGVQSRHCVDFLARLMEVNPTLRMTEYQAQRHPWLVEEEIDSVNSSMEVDDDRVALDYGLHSPPGLSDAEDEGWEKVEHESVNGDESRCETIRGKKDDYIGWSEEENEGIDTPTQGTQIKKILNYKQFRPDNVAKFDEDEAGDDSFAFGNIPSGNQAHGANSNSPAKESARPNSGVLGLQGYQFVSEKGAPQSQPEVQVVSSQFSENVTKEHISNAAGQGSSPQKAAGTAEAQTAFNVAGEVNPQNLPSEPKHEKLEISSFLSSYQNLNATKILPSSAASSVRFPPPEPTISRQQMPPPVSKPPPPIPMALESDSRKSLVATTSHEGIFDYYDNDDDDVPPGYWGKIVPLSTSLSHPTVLFNKQLVSFGRFKPCTVVYEDGRLSKRHCAFHSAVSSPTPEGAPLPKPLAWFYCTSSNPCWVNESKVPKGVVQKLRNGDKITLFKDKNRNEQLAFRICLAPVRSEVNPEGTVAVPEPAESAITAKNGQVSNRDGDYIMSG